MQAGSNRGQRRLSIGGLVNAVTALCQGFGHPEAGGAFVVGDENSKRHDDLDTAAGP